MGEPPAQRALGAIFEAAVAQVAAQVVGDRAVDPFETDLLLPDMGAVVAQVEAAGNAERVVEAEEIVERDVDPRGVEAREIGLALDQLDVLAVDRVAGYRKRVGLGKGGSGRVELGVRCIIKKKK